MLLYSDSDTITFLHPPQLFTLRAKMLGTFKVELIRPSGIIGSLGEAASEAPNRLKAETLGGVQLSCHVRFFPVLRHVERLLQHHQPRGEKSMTLFAPRGKTAERRRVTWPCHAKSHAGDGERP